jgi:hypothetical protein
VGTRRGKTGYWMEGEKGRYKMYNEERERDNWARVKYGCIEMREREEKKRGEILNEDGREIR